RAGRLYRVDWVAQPRWRHGPQHPDPERGTGRRPVALPHRRGHRRRLRPASRTRRNPRQGLRHAAGAGSGGVSGTVRLFRGSTPVEGLQPDDRGFRYGEGVFETMRAHRGAVPWWPAHWQRLARGAARLGLPLPPPGMALAEASALLAGGNAVLRLQLTRGGGGRGYASPGTAEPTWVLSLHSLPPVPAGEGLRLRWCGLRLAAQPALAGIKHCNRLEQVLARAELDTG